MKFYKQISATALIVASLALTSCAQDVPSDKNRVAGPSSEASASSSPSSTPAAPTTFSPTLKPVAPATDPSKAPLPEPGEEGALTKDDAAKLTTSLEKAPLQIDIDYAFKNWGDPKIEEVFPKKDFDTKEAVRYGLSLYQDLTSLQDFYEPRDGTKDFEIVQGFADRMTAELVGKVEAQIKQDGHFKAIPTVNSEGHLGTTSDGVKLDFAGVPQSFWNSPGITTVPDEKYGNVIRVAGKRTIAVPVESGETVEIQQDYVIDITPSGEKEWLVSGLYWGITSTEIIK